jgi:hypothetical protein
MRICFVHLYLHKENFSTLNSLFYLKIKKRNNTFIQEKLRKNTSAITKDLEEIEGIEKLLNISVCIDVTSKKKDCPKSLIKRL